MKTTLTALAVAASAATAFGGVRIAIDPGAKGHDVPKTLYGIFFEDINHAADGGVFPELIENRGFDWKTKDLEGWQTDFCGDAMARVSLQDGRPVHPATARHLRIECFDAGDGCGVRNFGYGGVSVEAGKKYDLTFYGKALWDDVEVSSKPLRTFYHVCGLDESTNEYIVKCVNLDADGRRRVTVDFGERLPSGLVKIESLSGDPKVVNDLGNPTRCATKLSTMSFAGGTSFTSEVEPFSLTVFRIGR